MRTKRAEIANTTGRPLRFAPLLLSLACLSFSAMASANTEQLPAAYTSLVTYHQTPHPEAATREAGKMLAADNRAGKRRDPLHMRYRKIKLLSYSRAVEVGKEDVIVKVQSPGKRKSIMMVELKF